MALRHLEPVVPVRRERAAGINDDHPMRQVTRQVAAGAAGWDDDRRRKVAELFDDLAPVWHTREVPGRYDALEDALDRGEVPTDRPTLELGSGTGLATPMLAERFGRLVAVDLSMEMLRRAPADAAPRIRADSSRLPVADGAVDVLLVINMLLFPEEMTRVLAHGGVLVWVNTSGGDTPIHLPAEAVMEALPGGWDGVASEAGTGTWLAARRP